MTPEILAMEAAMDASGLAHKVTSTQRTPRFPGDTSFHIIGQACDFAGPSPWNNTKAHPPLTAIWEYWMTKAGSLRELIYSGAPFWISKGKVLPISTLPSDLRAAHWNHVHVAVPKGWRYTPEIHVPDVTPDPTPNYDINGTPLSLSALFNSEGVCTGYIILGSDGGVFGFGPGARYFGRVS